MKIKIFVKIKMKRLRRIVGRLHWIRNPISKGHVSSNLTAGQEDCLFLFIDRCERMHRKGPPGCIPRGLYPRIKRIIGVCGFDAHLPDIAQYP